MNVSVVIPTLNEENNIVTCLNSLSPQLDKNDEVIIVDGGSEDSTVEICKEAGCEIFLAKGVGIGLSRGIGADKAKNEIIVSMDADSVPPKGWLNKIKRHFKADKNLTVLWGSIEDKNGVPIRNLVGKFSTVFRGASGNNTAFRKSAYEKLDSGYPDINFMEDVVIITKLSMKGKAKRDKNLIMTMNMDRKRYQTLPIMSMGLVGTTLGHTIGGKYGDMAKWGSVGLAGTEILYEGLTETPLHHDEFGSIIAGVGQLAGGDIGNMSKYIGAGTFLHHAVTEGVSMSPTKLYQNTDEEIGS